MEDLNKREKAIILVIVVFLTLGLLINYIYRNKRDLPILVVEEELEDYEEEGGIEELNDTEVEEEEKVIIHIIGAVKNPGVIQLIQGERLIDAIDLAGGFQEDADKDRVNLAREIQDGEQVYIPKIGEDIEIILESFEENVIKGVDNSTNRGKIDINTCEKSELMTLPGIGDKTSDKIIDYRKTNKFNRIEDIMLVSGIGEKKFEAIRDLIKTK